MGNVCLPWGKGLPQHMFHELQFSADKLKDPNVIFIDLRSEEEYIKGHLRTAINLPAHHLLEARRRGSMNVGNRYDSVKQIVRYYEQPGYRLLPPEIYLYTQTSASADFELVDTVYGLRHMFGDSRDVVYVIDEGYTGLSNGSKALTCSSIQYRENRLGDLSERVQSTVSEIIEDSLYLGRPCNAVDEGLLQGFTIQHVANFCVDPLEFNDIEVTLADGSKAKVKNRHFPPQHEEFSFPDELPLVLSYLIDLQEKGERVLLISSVPENRPSGEDRSVSFAIAFLMKTRGWTLRKALQHVLEFRSWVAPAPSYIAHLLRFEYELQGAPSDPKYPQLPKRSSPSLPIRLYWNYFANMEDLGEALHWIGMTEDGEEGENGEFPQKHEPSEAKRDASETDYAHADEESVLMDDEIR